MTTFWLNGFADAVSAPTSASVAEAAKPVLEGTVAAYLQEVRSTLAVIQLSFHTAEY